MSRAFSNIKRTLLAAAGVVAGMALGAEGQLSMGTMEGGVELGGGAGSEMVGLGDAGGVGARRDAVVIACTG